MTAIEPRRHSDAIRRRVIGLFFLGLLFMATLALGIDRICAD